MAPGYQSLSTIPGCGNSESSRRYEGITSSNAVCDLLRAQYGTPTNQPSDPTSFAFHQTSKSFAGLAGPPVVSVVGYSRPRFDPGVAAMIALSAKMAEPARRAIRKTRSKPLY